LQIGNFAIGEAENGNTENSGDAEYRYKVNCYINELKNNPNIKLSADSDGSVRNE